jgi:protein-disulfide isomerase/uncharacterized membrane protein
MAREREQEPATLPPARGWRIAFLVICTVGVCLSADLLRLHVNVYTDPDYQSYCAMSERVNCETVALSEYAVFFGLPLAIWGLLAYLAMGALTVWGLREKPRSAAWPFGLLYWLSLFASLVAIILLGVSHFLVQSACIVCIGTYLVSFALLATSYGTLRRSGLSPVSALIDDTRSLSAEPQPVALFGGTFVVLTILLWIAIPPYWRVEASASLRGIQTGETSDGDPWIGARRPTLEVVEYSDYQCPHCRLGHRAIRNLVEAYPEQVRLVHRHYPLDQHCNTTVTRSFHENACQYARMAYCAQQQGRFWEANDYLFESGRGRGKVLVPQLAAHLGIDAEALSACTNSAAAERAVQENLATGDALRVRGTPSYVIGEYVYPGAIPQDVIDAALLKQPERG